MTPEQIKALAKQAGGTTHTTVGDSLMIFPPAALLEFVRLVRKQAFGEAATFIEQGYFLHGQSPIQAIRESAGTKDQEFEMKQLLQQALAALEKSNYRYGKYKDHVGAMQALRAAIAQPDDRQCKYPLGQSTEYQQALAEQIEQELFGSEPVAYQYLSKDGTWKGFTDQKHYENTVRHGWPVRALYLAAQAKPAPYVPLTDEQIYKIWPYPEGTNFVQAVARAIEQAVRAQS